jgi:hypothetical protein
VLFEPGTSTVINTEGSVNTLHGVTITDDLNATGVDLTFLGYSAYWESSGAPIAHTFSNVGGVLTFDNFPIIPAGEQFVIEINVVLQDTPTNAPGTQFVNTAKWDFGRLVEGTFYEPLPGEWGISEPLTVAAPNLVVTKTGPATLNLGVWGDFDIDVQNTGLGDAWNVTILDRLPDGPNAGMCDTAPDIQAVQVFQADGVTPVPGKGPLVEGSDYTMNVAGAPSCEVSLTMLTAAGVVGGGERLVINYRTRLDTNSQEGAALTNVVAATEWFNDATGNPDRVVFTRSLTDGTVGVADHEDAHTTTVEHGRRSRSRGRAYHYRGTERFLLRKNRCQPDDRHRPGHQRSAGRHPEILPAAAVDRCRTQRADHLRRSRRTQQPGRIRARHPVARGRHGSGGC